MPSGATQLNPQHRSMAQIFLGKAWGRLIIGICGPDVRPFLNGTSPPFLLRLEELWHS